MVTFQYADFVFHPRRKNDIAFIVELKKDELPEVAIEQIREKEYIEKLKKENEDKKVLLVSICYNSKEKEHSCPRGTSNHVSIGKMSYK